MNESKQPSSVSDPAGPQGALPGFIAMHQDDPGIGRVIQSHVGVTTSGCGAVNLTSWGLASLSEQSPTFALSRVARTAHGRVLPAEVAERISRDPATLTCLLPPFAAVRGAAEGVTMVADSMGFRQLYHSSPGADGHPVLSTSALLAGWASSAELDHTAVAVQSLLGWQLGQRTLFRGIEKLAPGAVAHLNERGVHVTAPSPPAEESITLEKAVALAAALLRSSLNALLDDHPDAVLQLTGGQDSRILLSAIPVGRRRGLRAMTLGVPGSGDVVVAKRLAERYGLRHEIHGLETLEGLSGAEAWELSSQAAMRLDGMSDPIALAALGVVESNFDQGVRISGLGGEVARGFYYAGAVRERAFTPKDAERLAAWRMFVNEAVEPGLLNAEFSAWARATADKEVARVMAAGGHDWFSATDDLYLRHRMQRWAGNTDTAVLYNRVVINPMLCQQFLSIASRLPPALKAHSQFLARLQMELDPELGRIPLEGRPPPAATAHPGVLASAQSAASTGRRFVKKVSQRIRRANRAPAGGFTLSGKTVEHWREHPELLTPARVSEFVRAQWIDEMLDGTVVPRPSSVAFLTNLIVANRRDMDTGRFTNNR